MSEWWTYRLSDFLLFAPSTYYRLFELHNAAWWPLQGPAVGLGLLCALLGWRGCVRAAGIGLGLAWLWVAWSFHLQRYAAIQWAAPWFAAGFALQGLLWLAWAALAGWGGGGPGGAAPHSRAGAAARGVGLALWGLALAGQPLLALALGRPLAQTEWFALMPDPTVLGTLGALLLLPARRAHWLWPLPLGWCAVGGATLWAMRSPDALLLPGAAALALLVRVLMRGPARRR